MTDIPSPARFPDTTTYIDERNCRVWVRTNYLSPAMQEALAAECRALPLVQHYLGKMWGKDCYQQRLSLALGPAYPYSGRPHPAVEWSPVAAQCCAQVNRDYGTSFNGGLVNLYRSGTDYISDHSDDEKSLARGGAVYGVSLGVTRDIILKWKDKSKPTVTIPLPPGSLFGMEGETQRLLTHGMPVRKRVLGERISLTLRQFAGERG